MSFQRALIAAGLLLFASAAAANAEEITTFRMCHDVNRCTVSDVSIDPCTEALYNEPCDLPRGQNASITFKYTPDFSTQAPRTRLYAVTPIIDLPFLDMDTNACLYTNCPVVDNKTQSWAYNLYVSELYPKSDYTVKFKFWDNDKNANIKNECCFSFKIKIV